MVDDAIEQLKAAHPQQEPRAAIAGSVPAGFMKTQHQRGADDQHDQLQRVQQPVGGQRQRRVVGFDEMVPGQHLVKDDLVDRRHHANAQQDRGEQRRADSSLNGIFHIVYPLADTHPVGNEPGFTGSRPNDPERKTPAAWAGVRS